MPRSTTVIRVALASIVAVAAALPAPACPPSGVPVPDWDGSGAVDCSDLRSYVEDFVLSNPCADYNGVSGVSVQDLFDYVTAYQGAGGTHSVLLGELFTNNCRYPGTLEDGWQVPFDTRPCYNTDGAAEPQCFTTTGGQVHNDTWFAYEALANGVAVVSVAHPNARVAVYDAGTFSYTSCPAGSAGKLLACADSGSFAGSPGGARLTVGVATGRYYLIRVGDGGGTRAAGTVSLSFAAAGSFAGGGTSTTAPFSVAAGANGTGNGWTWAVQTPTQYIRGSSVGVVCSNCATSLRNRFVTALSSAGITASPVGAADFTITVPGGDVPTLWVGPAGGDPTCRVFSPLNPLAPPPCSFNPEIIALSGRDCNANGIDDTRDIQSGHSTDYNHDGVPDGCDCAGDFNRDQVRSPQDIFDFLAAFHAHLPAGDFDRSGSHTPQDIFNFLAAFFSPCP